MGSANAPSKIILHTERLILRTFCDSDLAAMAAISADPIVMEHFPATQDVAATAALIARINQHFAQFGYALYAVEEKTTSSMLGFVGLNQPSFTIAHFKPAGLPIVEIGWRLAQAAWGQGYATEAAKAVLAHAFEVLNLPEIISFTARTNLKSQRVMQKIGLINRAEDNFNHPNLPFDSPLCAHVLYRLSKSVFISQKSRHLI